MADKSFVPICGQLAVVVLLLVVSVVVLAGSSLAADVSQPMGSFTVTVIDEEQQPIEGVLVRPWALRSIQGHGRWRVDGRGASRPVNAKTNAAGKATISYPVYANFDEKIETTYVTVGVEHPEYVDESSNEIPVTDHEVQYQKNTGNQLPSTLAMKTGAEIHLIADLDSETEGGKLFALWSGEAWNAETLPERNGASIRLPIVPAGKQLVRLVRIANGQATHFSPVETLTLASNTKVEHQLSLVPSRSVSGQLSDNIPRPVINGRVSAYLVDSIKHEKQEEQITWSTWAPVDSDGQFKIDGLPAKGTLQLAGLADGWMGERGKPPTGSDENEQRVYDNGDFGTPQCFTLERLAEDQVITLDMVPLLTCHFSAVNLSGAPVANTEISMWPNIRWYGGGSQVYCDTLFRSVDMLLTPDRSFQAFAALVNKSYPTAFTGMTDASGEVSIDRPHTGNFSYVARHEDYELPIIGGKRKGSVQVPKSGSVEIKVVLQTKSGDVLGNWDKASEVLSSCTSAACLALREDERFAKLQDKSRDLFKELESNPDPSLKAMAYQALAEALEQLGEPEQAKRSLKVAIEAAPSDKKPELNEQLKKLDSK